jgi:P27 family predicted phage terminase small subunit
MPGNSNSGRKANPLEIQAAKGDKRAMKKLENSLIRVDAELTCPEYLDEIGQEYWHYIYPMLYNARAISATEAHGLAMLCQKYSDWWEAKEKCQQEGRYIELMDRTGSVYHRKAPWAMDEKDAYDQYWRTAKEFGLTPATRSSVRPLSADKEDEEDCIT